MGRQPYGVDKYYLLISYLAIVSIEIRKLKRIKANLYEYAL